MEMDDIGNLRSMVWADSRARNAYLTFADVIVFDVTYKTNRFLMPFAPFTGVNHHRQSTLFGCALLADEKEKTFTWLFQQWLKCMFGVAPGCIITHMDVAMRNGLRNIFPKTCHRFCSWHIHRHLIEHCAGMRDSESDFCKDYNKWFYKREIPDCEKEWENFVDKYGISENNWLAKMWELRSHWVPAYFRETFTAGMTSSSRSESINLFFDGYVNLSTTLPEFVKQYAKALADRRKKESEEDFRTKSSNVVLISRNKLEAQGGKCYTRTMFNIFQSEFKDSNDCWYELLGENGNVTEYSVGLSDDEPWKWCKVVYEESDEGVKATCACAKFETVGILCKHILRIMSLKRLSCIPERYILNRWTIGARFHIDGGVGIGEDDNDDVTPVEKWYIISKCQRVVEVLESRKIVYKKMDETLDAWLEECEQEKREKQNALSSSGSKVQSNFITESLDISIRDLLVVKTKGRPKAASRFKSPLEVSQSELKKRTCKKCGGKGHYSTTCNKKKKMTTPKFEGEEGEQQHEEERMED
ncbi:protein FAR1-RELATED SEQUENCE 5-like [Tasmannia lanceolata]|uniref:protein FAR1-RELATED SEQUENCE 5-like n=1 Tax=Tasmannia lanceolata TaxID=3420 RepID=UPI004063FEE4